MPPTRKFLRTAHLADPENLVSLLCEPLPAGDVIVASAGEWRREINGRWRFWQAFAWRHD